MAAGWKFAVLGGAGVLAGAVLLDGIPIAVAHLSAEDNATSCAISGATAVARVDEPTTTSAQAAYNAASSRCDRDYGAVILEDDVFRHNADGTVTLTYHVDVDSWAFSRIPGLQDMTVVEAQVTHGVVGL